LILQVIAGSDPSDPGSAARSFHYTPQYGRPVNSMLAGYAPADFTEWADPAARPVFAEALTVLKACGIQMKEAKLPAFPYGPVISTIIGAEGASVFEPLITSGGVNDLADPAQIAGLKANLDISAITYLKAMRVRRLIQNGFQEIFTTVDVLIAPGRLGPASPIDQPLDQPRSTPVPQDPGMNSLIPAGNLAGLPALVLPCGFAGNLPVALQVVGAPFTENQLLAIGREFQSRTDWHKRRPPNV
jgi:aspartyl-tRNA(Asn)/glutamyl-tRNA(Gln) amidotransferase subunit A